MRDIVQFCLVLAATTQLLACSESNDAAPKDAMLPVDTTPETTSDGPPIDGPTDTTGAGGITINEMRASGGDYIELFNGGSGAIDLSGWSIGGTKSDGGLSAPFTFPAGTSVAAGGYLLIIGKDNDAGGGPTGDCMDAAPSCFHVTWAVSSKGETLTLLKPGGAEAEKATYPADAVASGQSYGRLPNGTGAFAANRPTPAAKNEAP